MSDFAGMQDLLQDFLVEAEEGSHDDDKTVVAGDTDRLVEGRSRSRNLNDRVGDLNFCPTIQMDRRGPVRP